MISRYYLEAGMLLLILLLFCRNANALHLSGVWSTDKVYTFLARFAFQKTSVAEIEGTRGYIFGNISSLDYSFNSSSRMPPATLVIVDGEYVTDLYGNASRPVQLFSESTNGSHFNLWQAETARCQAMFSRINTLAWHRKCSPKAKMDFLRQAPCTTGGLCSEEEEPSRVQPLSQFTFTVQDRRQPRFWYLSLIACYRNLTTCQWETSALPRPNQMSEGSDTTNALRLPQNMPMRMRYDIWMVNGVPRLQDYYRFEHQFSFEYHDIFEIYLTFGALYLLLGVILHIKYKGEYEPLACLLFAHIWLSFVAATLRASHLAAFAFDGEGASSLFSVGDVAGLTSDALLIILVLATADVGFPILPAELSHFQQKVRQYRKRQYRRVMSTASFRDNESTNTATTTHVDGRTRTKEVHLPPSAATWSVALCRTEAAVAKAVASAAQMNASPSVASLTFTVYGGKETEEANKPFLFCFGLFKCSHRRMRIFLYLGSLLTVIISIELGLYIWAMLDQDPVLDISVWNTTPGRLLVAVRFAVIFWFLALLYKRGGSSNVGEVIEPLHFAAAYLLWLLTLPVVVFVSHTAVSPFWRHKTIIGVMHLSNFLASVLYAQLINRANAYASH
nr:hypothetical protein HmN_000247200 [Hymenolepis microstoma]